jgi:hypothetical protein
MTTSYSLWVGDVWVQFEDGVKRREGPKRNGTARSRHEDGELAEEYELVEALIVGEHRDWHDNGILAKTTPFVSGRVHGTARQWNRDGKLFGEYTMTDGRGVTREWDEDGTLMLEHEQVPERAASSRVFDDLGKAHEVFLWNGKRVSKKIRLARLARPREGQMLIGGQDSQFCSLPPRSAERGVTITNDAEAEAIKEETEEIDPDHICMLKAIERINGPTLEAERRAMAELLAATCVRGQDNCCEIGGF